MTTRNQERRKLDHNRWVWIFLLIALFSEPTRSASEEPRVSISSTGEGYEGPNCVALIVGVHRSGDTNIPVSVTYATGTNGTAMPGVDFEPVSGRLEFAPGEIFKQFTVSVLDDGFVEGTETVELLLSHVSPGASCDETPQFGLIIDDETPANLDYSFAPEFPRWPEISMVRVQRDGKILLTGSGLYAGGEETRILRLHADGGVDRSFRAGLTNWVSDIEQDFQGKILVTIENEDFHSLELVRLLPDGAIDGMFSAESFDEGGLSILPQTNGKVVLALWNAGRLVRLMEDGSADTAFNLNASAIAPGFNLGVNAVQQQTDGKLLVLTLPSGALLRLTADGSRDSSFQELFPSSSYVGFRVLSDDRIVVYGDQVLSGRKIIRLNRNGDLDPTFPEPQFPLLHYNFSNLIGEADGRLYFNTGDKIITINSDGTVGISLYAETGRWSDGMGGILLNAVLHQGAALCWNPAIQGVNRSITPLARVVFEAPDNAFAFDREWRGTSMGPGLMADESDGSIGIVIRRLGDISRAASVDYATQAGSARPGLHYVSTTGTLTFGPMEAEKNVTIPLIQDEVFNGIPAFFVVLSNPSVPAVLDRSLQVGIRDREFGLVMGQTLSHLDGSRQSQFDLTGPDFRFWDYKNSRVEGSSDLKSWGQTPTTSFGWVFRRLAPPSLPLPPGQGHYFYRASRD